MRIPRCAALLFAALIVSSFAVPGDIDPTFNTTGKLRTALGGGGDQGYAVARQSDGRLVVAGASKFLLTGYDFTLLRFNANGTPDSTFGTAGRVRTAITTGDDYATAVAILSSGKIMVAGRSDTNLVLARYNADGSVDTTFGSGTGRILRGTSSNASSLNVAMVVQSDSKSVVLAAGVVYRFNTDGTLDLTFSGDGIATRPKAAEPNIGGGCQQGSYYSAIAMEGNKIVIAGATTSPANCYYTDASLVRFNADGSRDATFGTNGMAVAPHTADRQEYAYGIAFVAPNTDADHIVLVGSSGSNLGLWSFNRADGSIDTTFGNGGRVVETFGGSGGTGVAIGRQTNLGLVSGIIVSGKSGSSFVTARFTLNGALDTTFAGGVGYTRTTVNANSSGSAADMIVQATDNRPVVVGEISSNAAGGDADLALLRYTAGGVLDTTFDGDGARTEDIGEYAVPLHSILPLPDGKLIAVSPRYLARFNADGSLDNSFDADGRVAPRSFTNTALRQPDGKILVGDDYFRLARYNADGSLDFDFNGSIGTARANAIALQPDGKILVAGSVPVGSVTNFYIRRFLPNGTNDPSYTNSVTPFDTGNDLATSIAVQPDGRIVAAGIASGGVVIIRCNPDGSLDPSFSFDGKQNLSAISGSAPHVKLDGDKIYVSGFQYGSSTRDFALVRLNADGSPDTSFDGDGVATAPDASLNDDATDLAVQADGKILVAGYGAPTSSSTARDFVVVRFNSGGSVDTGYGNNGRTVLDFQSNSNDSAAAIAFDTIGRAVIAGQSDGFLAIARLIGDPFCQIVSIKRQASDGHIIVDGLATRELAYYLQQAATLNNASFQYYSFLSPDAAGVWRFDVGTPTSPHFYRVVYP